MTGALVQAIRLLGAHKLRSLLTLFGLVWGTASVIFLVGYGQGSNEMLRRGFTKTGKNLGEVWAGKVGEDFTPAIDRRFLWFTSDDVRALRQRARIPEIIGAEAWQFLSTTFGQRALSVDVRGIDPQVMAIRGVGLAAGRGITAGDLDHRRRVIVLGDGLRQKLLGPVAGIGAHVRLDGTPFRVVGILEHVGTQLSRDRNEIDDQAWIPLTTMQASWPQWWTDELVVTKIVYRVPEPQLLDASRVEVRAILAERIGVRPDDEEAIGIYSPLDMLNRLPLEQTRGLLFVLAAGTLLIGGVGVLNMMLDSVHERRAEIGIRLAVGARRRDVLMQFFAETLAICLLGGLFGAALGIGLCLGLGALQVPDLIPVPVLDARVVVAALGVLVGVGVTAGVIPAWRAARVDPALTLRME